MLVAQFILVLLIVFVIDATVTAWRRGDRRHALVIGGSILFFVTVGIVQGVVIGWGIIPMPVTVSLFYQGLVMAMAYELSHDVLHTAALARRLQTSEAGLRESVARFLSLGETAPGTLWM